MIEPSNQRDKSLIRWISTFCHTLLDLRSINEVHMHHGISNLSEVCAAGGRGIKIEFIKVQSVIDIHILLDGQHITAYYTV